MSLTTTGDTAAAIEAVRSQRVAVEAALCQLELQLQLAPSGECLVEWTSPASLAYYSDLAQLLAQFAAVRDGLHSVVEALRLVEAEAEGE